MGVVKPALTYMGALPNCGVQGGGRGRGRGASVGDRHVCWRQEAPRPHIQAGTGRDPLQPHPLHADSAGRGTSVLFLAVLEAPPAPQPVPTSLAPPSALAVSVLTLGHVFAWTHPLCGYPCFSGERVTMTGPGAAWPSAQGAGPPGPPRLLPCHSRTPWPQGHIAGDPGFYSCR